MPVMPFGPTTEYRGFGAGFVDLPVSLQDDLATAVLAPLADQGLGSILVWRGRGGHDLKDAIERFNAGRQGDARAVMLAHPFERIWHEVGDPRIPGGHADSFATSIALYRHPELVRSGVALEPSRADVEWDDPDLNFTRYSESGIIGDASRASAELGKRLWDACVSWMAETIGVLGAHPSV